MEEEDLPRFMEGLCLWFRRYGFTMKVEAPARELESIEFCQCRPVFNGEQYTMCRNLHKALFTDVAHVGRSVSEIVNIRKSTGLCGQAWAKGLPVFSSFYQMLANGPGKAQVLRHSGTYWNAQGCCTGTELVTEEARISFDRAFGVNPMEQKALEGMYIELEKYPFNEPTEMFEYNPRVPSTEYSLYISEAVLEIVL
jgi:hypothetical protein